ncbi:glutaredoxin, partial [Laccaria bicolor S238N-H82]
STVSGNKVAIFSKSYCPYCANAKALFAKEFPGITPTVVELNLRKDGPEIQSYLLEKTGQRTVPNVFVAHKHIGGNDDTQALFRAGKLAQLLRVRS